MQVAALDADSRGHLHALASLDLGCDAIVQFLTVGFACTEKVPGPYLLDVAWIAAVRDMLGDEDVLKMNYSGGVLDAASGIIR